MGEGSYFNFDLILERVGETYRARVFDSPAGQAATEFKLPFSELELENFVLRMGRPRSGTRRVDSTEMEAVKGCGERLFRAVFSDNVYACFLRSRDAALEEEKGLRVRLHIDVPEFHDYPWEFLYNAHLNQFLALSKDTPVVRYLELPYPVQPLAVQPPLKILVMISSPEGFPQLNVEEEWRRLNNALAPLIRRSLVNLERLKNPTLSALQQHLRRGEYHIFHFIGHGKFSEHKQDGMLLLEDESGKGRAVSGQYLGTVLHDHRSLRLVVLNACEGARTSQEDPYAGVAQTLVLQGIPAVIAMQFEILETAAITFAQEFYGAVADGFPVDAAVSEARKAIFARGNDVEWGTPVLYMRTPQGVIFEIPEAQRVKQPLVDEPVPYIDKELEQKLDGLYTEGLAAFWVEDWDKACDRFQRILADRPDHSAAADKLAEAKRQRRLSTLYAQASEAQSVENWTLALNTLEELLKDAPNYKDAAAMLKVVKGQKQLAELYAEAKQLHAAKKWQAVAKVFAQIKSIEPEYPDPDNLLSTAEKELDELKRQTELKELYSRAVREIDAGHWGEAQGLLKQLQDLETGFLETEKLLSKVEIEIRNAEEQQKRQDQINTLYEQAHGLLRSKKWHQAMDKIEAIRKLDEQFEDPEKIAERAQVELAREEQEAERQNELAALYAEAVRLLHEEKYQEALEKWQDIKSTDPRYPDRQKVQRMARKSLAALAKPVSKKSRINVPKSFWIGLSGIAIVVIVMIAINMFRIRDHNPSLVTPIVPTAIVGETSIPTAPQTEEKIIFSSTRGDLGDQLYLMDPDGGNVEQITFDPGQTRRYPSISPNGDRIAFSSGEWGSMNIYLIKPDGSDLVTLTDLSGDEMQPMWSPSGETIVFSTTLNGNTEVYSINVDGTNLTRLTNIESEDGTPCWSPEGTKIAFHSDRDGDFDIYIMNPDGSDVTRLTEDSSSDITPSWSPDGEKIAFRSNRDGNDEIYIMKKDGSEPINLTNSPGNEYRPNWSPNGKNIVFFSDSEGVNEVYSIDIASKIKKNLTNNPAGDGGPFWGVVIKDVGKDIPEPNTSTPKTPTVISKSPTATQVTSSYADPTMYDDFSNSAYDGSYNELLWHKNITSNDLVLTQGDGKLSIKVFTGAAGGGLDTNRITYPNSPLYLETKLFLDPATIDNENDLNVGFQVGYSYSSCRIIGLGGNKQGLECSVEYYQKPVKSKVALQEISPSWHIIRMEYGPEAMTFSYWLDGLSVGSIAIPTAQKGSLSAYGHLGINNYGPSKAPVGYVDYVRIGAIEDDPTIYDNFNDTSYDGRFNPTLWWYDPDAHSLKTESIQQDGLLVITQSGIDQTSFLTLKNYWGKSTPSNIYFETTFKIEMSSDGVIYLGVLDLGSCGLHTHSDWVDAYCGNSEFYRNIRVAHGSWNSFRIEIDVEENFVKYFINGEQFGENQLSSLLKSTMLYPHIGISSGTNRAENTRPVIAYVDNVRVSPLK